MKKALFYGTCSVLLLGALVYTKYLCNAPESNPIIEANIEALTDDEDILVDAIPCYSFASRDYDAAYVDCSTCNRYEGWHGYGTEAKCSR
jgi:hypothetical protein